MSYILEALKKSQQERELGQVPTLDASGIFTDDKEPISPNYWAFLAVALAALAVVIALYAAFRGAAQPRPTPARTAEALVPSATRIESSATRASGAGEPEPREIPTLAPRLAPPAAPLVEPPPQKRPARVATSAPPESVAEPAPPGGEHPAPSFDPAPAGPLNPDQEQELLRQLEAEQAAISASRGIVDEAPSIAPAPDEQPSVAPVPPDLIDDIESFKQRMRREQGGPPQEAKRKSAKVGGDPTQLRLTAEQRAAVPGYLMTVHVYDPDPAKRFVVINALRYHEGEATREGLRVEQILKDGTVLGYLGHSFYVAR